MSIQVPWPIVERFVPEHWAFDPCAGFSLSAQWLRSLEDRLEVEVEWMLLAGSNGISEVTEFRLQYQGRSFLGVNALPSSRLPFGGYLTAQLRQTNLNCLQKYGKVLLSHLRVARLPLFNLFLLPQSAVPILCFPSSPRLMCKHYTLTSRQDPNHHSSSPSFIRHFSSL